MKKIITIMALFALCLTANAQSTKEQDTQLDDNTSSSSVKVNKSIQLGDVNKDGEVSVTDLMLVIEYLLTGNLSPDVDLNYADIDGDGDVTISDYSSIRDIILNE